MDSLCPDSPIDAPSTDGASLATPHEIVLREGPHGVEVHASDAVLEALADHVEPLPETPITVGRRRAGPALVRLMAAIAAAGPVAEEQDAAGNTVMRLSAPRQEVMAEPVMLRAPSAYEVPSVIPSHLRRAAARAERQRARGQRSGR